MNHYDIIIRPVLTEKSTSLVEGANQYVFRVNKKANKHQIRQAIEKLFGVNVVKVNTSIIPGKPKRVGMNVGRTASYKKAVVKLAEGQSVDFFALETPADEAGVV